MSKILTDHGLLPLSSLRLIVPPLQLVSAALWEIVKQGADRYYGLLEEFVTTVLETVPELLTYTERVQLVMGLRAKMVLELCRNNDFVSPQDIQPHLSRINTYITNQAKEISSSEVKASLTNFLKLVHTLVNSQCQRDIFYQKIYPTVFGPKYDSALQTLMRKFLFNLQKLLPAPNLEQTSLWLSLSPSILKECVDFMNQPQPLNTLIQHHKHHGHKVPQALSSSDDDCILSSLSYHLTHVDNDEGDTLGSESKKYKEEEEDVEINSEWYRNVGRNGQQLVDDLTEDQGASVEVILQPFDESESNDDDDMDKKRFHYFKTGTRTSSKTFKCLACGQDFGSRSKLKKHKITHGGCCTNTMRSEDELSSLASVTTLNQSNLNSLLNFEQSHCDSSLVCHVCGKVFTYRRNFDKHQKTCVVSSKQQAETDPQCSTSLAHRSETKSSSQEQMHKRSSRVKQCSFCRKVFTCSADLTRHMRCHTEQSPYLCSYCGEDFDSDEDSEMHQEGKCRGSNQHSQDNSSSDANQKNQSGQSVVSSGITQIPTIPDSPANSQAKSPLTCQECGQGFTYYKNFDEHQKTCVVSSKLQAETDPQCTTSLAHHSETKPVDNTKESFPCETEALNVVPQESTSSQEQTCKRSSRVKQCSFCRKIFTCSADLTRHMRCHTEQSPYLCSYCGKDFDSGEDSEMHREGKCKCRGSNQHSQDNSSSDANQKNQSGQSVVSSGITQIPTIPDSPANSQAKSPLTCQECGQGFTYLKNLEKHKSKCSERASQRKKRTNTNHIIINGCNFRSADNTNGSSGEASAETKEIAKSPTSTDHADGSQTNSRSIECTMCAKNFSKFVHMKRHYAKSHNVSGSYPCPLCKRTFVRLGELIRHQQNKIMYQCAACKKCFPKPGVVKYHEKVHSASVTPRICETCGKSFKYLTHLLMHQRKHREQPPSVCSYCGKRYSSKDCLRVHMMRHTSTYSCPVCEKKFAKKLELDWHMYKHTGQAPYLCDICGKGWPCAAQLRLHMIQHTEERPFKCEDCGACYKRGSHLIAHRRSKHMRLRPFLCEVCSKAFRLKCDLKKHMIVHTRERPFKCPRCSKTFTRPARLRAHREKACL